MQDNSNARMTPLLPPDWDDEILDALGAFPSGLKFVLSRWEDGGDDAPRDVHAGQSGSPPRIGESLSDL